MASGADFTLRAHAFGPAGKRREIPVDLERFDTGDGEEFVLLEIDYETTALLTLEEAQVLARELVKLATKGEPDAGS